MERYIIIKEKKVEKYPLASMEQEVEIPISHWRGDAEHLQQMETVLAHMKEQRPNSIFSKIIFGEDDG